MTDEVRPSTPVDALPGEPQKLTIPGEAVTYLLNVAIREAVGNAWWNGFVTAHGVPSWIATGQWAISAGDAEVVRAQRTNGVAR